MSKTLMRGFNAVVILLLRSPLHGLFSRMFVLITVTGRKTGRVYTTPVQYQQSGQVLTFVSDKQRVWWRNLRGGAPVTLRLRGRTVRGHAEVIEEDEALVRQTLLAIYPRLGARLAERAAETVVVRVQLQEA